MSGNYSFIDYLEPENYVEDTNQYTGKLILKLKTITPLFIGSGFEGVIGERLYKSFVRYRDEYIIPGSSLKGALRSTCQMLSHSCIEVEKEVKKSLKLKNECDCITCKIFGKMGVKAKINVGEFRINREESKNNEISSIIDTQELYTPNINLKDYYVDGRLKGIKIYWAKKPRYEGDEIIPVEVINPQTVFEGEIMFNMMDKNELSLICCALGLDKSFNFRLGGIKPNGFGSVEFISSSIKTSKELDVAELAKKHGSGKVEIEVNKSKIREFYSIERS